MNNFLFERISDFIRRTGREPKALILSRIEIAKLRLALEAVSNLPIWEVEMPTTYMGIPIIEARDAILPEDI